MARPTFDGRGQVLDSRYNHGRYYPPAGTARATLPEGYRPYFHGGNRYYFSGGVWYAPRGPGFVVIAPPVGLVVGVLPPYYSTVWFGGVPYYYADNTYYRWNGSVSQYETVSPPPGLASQGGAGTQAGGSELIAYPKNGQSQEQQGKERRYPITSSE